MLLLIQAADILILSDSGTDKDDEDEYMDALPDPTEYTNIYFHHGKLVKAAPSTILGLCIRGCAIFFIEDRYHPFMPIRLSLIVHPSIHRHPSA